MRCKTGCTGCQSSDKVNVRIDDWLMGFFLGGGVLPRNWPTLVSRLTLLSTCQAVRLIVSHRHLIKLPFGSNRQAADWLQVYRRALPAAPHCNQESIIVKSQQHSLPTLVSLHYNIPHTCLLRQWPRSQEFYEVVSQFSWMCFEERGSTEELFFCLYLGSEPHWLLFCDIGTRASFTYSLGPGLTNK